ncbi:TadE family type IV pilus minor pilin [Propionibacterium acidifaciens]|uniref:TadE family type IV pilus minor pilin n=1 Tax=Propionibacterium acidifaciens TaxID=556499 RepID=UPI0023F2232A|nr:TadE family type IV pilus minor pilin [Propionibacterium acidifaciens]
MRVIRTIPSRCSHDRCFPDLSIRRARSARSARSARRGAERGMVTVELAVSILSAALMASCLCWVIGVVGAQMRCQDSAVAIARQLARGDEAAAERARASVPPGSEVLTDVDDGVVRVSVTDELRWGRLGPVRVSGRATVTEEPHAREQRP